MEIAELSGSLLDGNQQASDVVRAGLRLLEEHETKVKVLQDALRTGLESGEPRPFDFEAFKARKRAALQAQ